MRRTIACTAAILTALSLAACASTAKTEAEDEAMCKEVKPGTVTTVNHYCVIMLEDPVNPTVVREYKGQRVGFCCKGCLGKWDAMSDSQKDAAIVAAVAKGKPAT